MYKKLAKFEYAVFEMPEQTDSHIDRHTDTMTAILCTSPGAK